MAAVQAATAAFAMVSAKGGRAVQQEIAGIEH